MFIENQNDIQEIDYEQFSKEQHKLDPKCSYPNVETVGFLAKDYEDKSVYSEDEGIDDYKQGGYHTVFVGEVLHGRYVVL